MVVLNVKENQESDFELNFDKAVKYISRTRGYMKHSLKKCLETKNRYLLIIKWENLDSHMVNFRESEDYIKWRDLLHHFYEPTPIVEHYQDFK